MFDAFMDMQKKGAAFSLIELLVVVAIIAISALIILLPYSQDRIIKELEASGREFFGTVREAQNYALTGKQLVGTTTPCGYEVNWSGANYQFVYLYKSGSDCSQRSAVYTKSLKRGAQFVGTGAFHFTLPHAIPSFGTSQVFPIIIQNRGQSYVICVYSEGRIQEHRGSSCPA